MYKGKLLANIYMTNYIAVIEPSSGQLLDMLNMTDLTEEMVNSSP